MERIRCFHLVQCQPTRTRRWLRRYNSADCPLPQGYHNAQHLLGDFEGEKDVWPAKLPGGMPTWPTACACGYKFTPEDAAQFFSRRLWQRTDSGEVMTLEESPPGAMWYADWYGESFPHGPDGRVLIVKCPDGWEWNVDSRASNCTLPQDNAHRCWVRHGTPPNINVDKNGNTCQAGAGSILTGRAQPWHGFLRNGFLEGC